VGQTMNVAARLEQMAAPGSILISAGTLNLAEGYVQEKPLGPSKVIGPSKVKGLERPLEVFEITGASKIRSRLRKARQMPLRATSLFDDLLRLRAFPKVA